MAERTVFWANVALNQGAMDVAGWSNGTPLIGTRTVAGYQTVELNFVPDKREGLTTAGTRAAVADPSSLALLGASFGRLLARRRARAVTG